MNVGVRLLFSVSPYSWPRSCPYWGFLMCSIFATPLLLIITQYLADIGLIALVVSGATIACERAGEAAKSLGVALAVLLLLGLGALTWKQASVYQNAETLWRDTITKNPRSAMAHNNLGTVLFESGRAKEAICRM